jgi:hypothetical protein
VQLYRGGVAGPASKRITSGVHIRMVEDAVGLMIQIPVAGGGTTGRILELDRSALEDVARGACSQWGPNSRLAAVIAVAAVSSITCYVNRPTASATQVAGLSTSAGPLKRSFRVPCA